MISAIAFPNQMQAIYATKEEQRQNASRRQKGSMDHPVSILVYGKDAALLNTRAQVLRQVGPVTQVATVEDLQSSLQEQPFGLMVLCHTGSAVEHDLALHLATSIQPDMKRLLVATGQTKPPAENVETLSNFAGPQALVDHAKLLLSQSVSYPT